MSYTKSQLYFPVEHFYLENDLNQTIEGNK